MGGVAFARFGFGGGFAFDRAIGHADDARLAVQFKEHPNIAFVGRITHGLQANLKRFARVDFGRNFLARFHAVKEGLGGQHPHGAIGLVAGDVIKEDFGIHQVAVQIFIVDLIAAQIFDQLGAGGF